MVKHALRNAAVFLVMFYACAVSAQDKKALSLGLGIGASFGVNEALDKTLHPVCKTKTKDDSYPSGHASTGYLMALALIDMVPEKRDEILARADDYGHNRMVCGVHYASDIVASRLGAYAIHGAMVTNAQYQTEMVVAKKELRQALGLAN